MAYRYYQTSYPGWGQSEIQFGAPPIPNVQPQPQWNGWDYYSAYAINPDPSLFYSIMNRAREYRDTGGVGLHEARTWHRRIYSGLVPLTRALPMDIGSAAAYEAYRVWRHHHSIMYGTLTGDIEREREGLIGMAIAEASHLWQYTGRPMDVYALREALESAALTASRIAYRVMEDREPYLGGRGSIVDDGYAGDDYADSHRYRRRRHSSIGSAPSMIGGVPSVGSAYGTPYSQPGSMPIPIQGSMGAGANQFYGGGGLPHSYGSTPSLLGGGGYPQQSNYPVIPGAPAPVGGFSVPHPGTMSGSYPGSSTYLGTGTQYPQQGYGSTVMAGQTTIPNVPPGSTIIIQQPTKRHRRNSSAGHKHRHHRSKSASRFY